METGDGDNAADDGIVAEDITQLVEHIELTGAHRLPDAPDWELATPADDLEDAPILIGEIRDDDPELASMSVADDPEQFTETLADLNELLPPGERPSDRAAAQAAERARWQARVEELRAAVAERDRRIAELMARLDALESGPEEPASASATPAPAASDARPPAAPADDEDYTQQLPVSELPPAVAPQVAPRLRRYLIGLDLVGCVHEISNRRISIGRTRDNDLRIVDPTVSRLHAMLSIRSGNAMLIDANSRNGIFVNGIQVRYAKLDDGDLVTFGTVRFRYRVGSDTAGAVTASA